MKEGTDREPVFAPPADEPDCGPRAEGETAGPAAGPEDFIGIVSFTARSLLESKSWDRAVTDSLARLGRTAGVGRTLIFRNSEGWGGETLAELGFQWVGDNMKLRGDSPGLLGMSYGVLGLGRWVEVLGRGGKVAAPVEDLPFPERRYLRGRGVKSVLAVPIFAGPEWWGMLVLEDCRSERSWTSLEKKTIGAMSEILGASILRRRREEGSRQSQTLFLNVLKSMDATVYVIDPKTYEIIYAHRPFRKTIEQDPVGRTCWKVLQKDRSGPCSFCPNDRLFDDKGSPAGIYNCEFENTYTGRRCTTANLALKWTDGRWVKLTVFLDKTAFRMAEEKFKKSEAGYRSLYSLIRLMCDNVPDLIWAKDLEGRILFVNKATAARLLNSEDTEEPIGKSAGYFARRERRAHPERPDWHEFGDVCFKSDQAVIECGEPRRFHEFGNALGRFLFLDVHKAPFWNENGEMIGTVGCGRDVTAEMNLETEWTRSEAQYSLLFEHTLSPLVVVDDQGRYLNANRAALDFLECGREELLGRKIRDASPPGLLDPAEEKRVPFLSRRTVETQYRVNGRLKTLVLNLVPIELEEQTYLYGIGLDITDRKRDEERIKASLAEKEILLREIHHRVKNNLSVLNSLLKLQARKIKDEKVREFFLESQSRIMAMSSVHDYLLRSDNLAAIDLKQYLFDLAGSVFRTFAVQAEGIELEVDIEKTTINLDKAVPLGLAVNELVVNALKHAFPKKRSGWVRIQGGPTARGGLRLEVSDNGVGLPLDFELRRSKTLGLELVTGLTENQLGGTLEISEGDGVRFVIITGPS